MSTFEEAIARAEAAHRVLTALDRAGFSECVAPGLDDASGLAHAVAALVPQDAPLPQRLSRDAQEEGILALVLHDGRSPAVEAELPALAQEALVSLGATGLALTLRALAPARALLHAHGLDGPTAARLLEAPHVAKDDDAPGAALGLEADQAELDRDSLDPARLERVLLGFLGKLRFRTYGTRTPEEVAARLAGRLSRRLPAVARRIQAARASLLELAAIDSSPEEALARGAALLSKNGVSLEAAESVREHARDLAALGVAPARIELAPRFFQEGSVPEALDLDPSWTLEAVGAGTLARGGSFAFRSGRAAVAW
ncbi:hypothetical protein HY251_09980, partial [bacterium]|nr:hypothetical protein [bacterium]